MKKLLNKYTLFIGLFWFSMLLSACKPKSNFQSRALNMDSLMPSLFVNPLTFSIAEAANTTLTFQVRNSGHQVVNTEPHQLEIVITGQKTMNLSSGINNGRFEDKWSALPPSETVERDLSSIAPVLFDQAGSYILEPKLNGKSGEIVTVTVVK